MDDERLADFLLFSEKYRSKFKRIANASGREYAADDVQTEAWLLAELWGPDGAPINLRDPRDVDRLFAYLYAKLVKRKAKIIRYSTRLDHSPYGDSEDRAHPLARKLAAPEDTQPLDILLALEDAAELPPDPEPYESRAAAYICLLQHHRNNMRSVADYLLISLSYCYFRCNEAREMARTQCVLPDAMGSSGTFFPGPWRHYRMAPRLDPSWVYPPWVQAELDLWPSSVCEIDAPGKFLTRVPK
ncbi:MAG: hypothetical protein WBA83_01200 [Burkholderiaceae bacterium]